MSLKRILKILPKVTYRLNIEEYPEDKLTVSEITITDKIYDNNRKIYISNLKRILDVLEFYNITVFDYNLKISNNEIVETINIKIRILLFEKLKVQDLKKGDIISLFHLEQFTFNCHNSIEIKSVKVSDEFQTTKVLAEDNETYYFTEKELYAYRSKTNKELLEIFEKAKNNIYVQLEAKKAKSKSHKRKMWKKHNRKMHIKKMLEELQKDIRTKIPRLMDLSRGCQIIDGNNFLYEIDNIEKDRDGYLKYRITSKGIYKGRIDSHELKYYHKIIGHPILLSDVIKWMYLKVDHIDFTRMLNTIALDWEGKYLSYQKEDLIKYLHDVINS